MVGASAAASASSGEGGAGAEPSSGAQRGVPKEVVQATERGDEEAVLTWLDGGGRVDAGFEYVLTDGSFSGMTLLMIAMAHGREGLAERCSSAVRMSRCSLATAAPL